MRSETQQHSSCVKRDVELAPMQMLSGISGAMYHASTSPLVLPAVVAHAPSPRRSCRELEAMRFVQKTKKGASPRPPMFSDTYSMISLHTSSPRNVDDVFVQGGGAPCRRSRRCRRPHRPPRGRRRLGGRPSRRAVGRRARPRRNRDKVQILRRAVWVETLSARRRKGMYRYIYRIYTICMIYMT